MIILGKDHIARAFHNVCRHRAYTITKKPAGSSLVLGCRYHGWSYDTKGNLVKAPQFDGIEGFDKSENGLFKIQTCTDRAGFIHMNLDAGGSHHAPSLEDLVSFGGEYGISASSKWLTGWEMGGAFNWKTIGNTQTRRLLEAYKQLTWRRSKRPHRNWDVWLACRQTFRRGVSSLHVLSS